MSSKLPLRTIATTARGFGSSGAGPGGRGGGDSTLIARPPACSSLAGARRRRPGRRARGRPRAGAGSRGRAVPSPPSSRRSTGKRRRTSSQAAVVVGRRMRGDDRAEVMDSRLPQQARDARLRAAAVEEDGAAVGVLDQRRVALAHVEERDRQPVRRGGADRPGRPRGRRRPPRAISAAAVERPARGDARARAQLVGERRRASRAAAYAAKAERREQPRRRRRPRPAARAG